MPIAKAHTLQYASGALRTPPVQYITALNYLCTQAHQLENVKRGHETKLSHTFPHLALSAQPCSISLGLAAVQKNTDACLSHGV